MTANEDRMARAGEFVLGLMDAETRRQAEIDLESDLVFREAVRLLSERLQALDNTVSPSAIPKHLWDNIEAATSDIEQQPRDIKRSGTSNVMPFPTGRSVYPRVLTLAASLMFAFATGYASRWVTAPEPEPVVFVVLQTPTNEPGAVFEAFADNSVRIIPLEEFAVPDGKIMQVWTLYDKAVGPVSLGTLPKAEIVKLEAAAFPTPAENQLYEITLEPAPGSPTGKPTGPILVKGFATKGAE